MLSSVFWDVEECVVSSSPTFLCAGVDLIRTDQKIKDDCSVIQVLLLVLGSLPLGWILLISHILESIEIIVKSINNHGRLASSNSQRNSCYIPFLVCFYFRFTSSGS